MAYYSAGSCGSLFPPRKEAFCIPKWWRDEKYMYFCVGICFLRRNLMCACNMSYASHAYHESQVVEEIEIVFWVIRYHIARFTQFTWDDNQRDWLKKQNNIFLKRNDSRY